MIVLNLWLKVLDNLVKNLDINFNKVILLKNIHGPEFNKEEFEKYIEDNADFITQLENNKNYKSENFKIIEIDYYELGNEEFFNYIEQQYFIAKSQNEKNHHHLFENLKMKNLIFNRKRSLSI